MDPGATILAAVKQHQSQPQPLLRPSYQPQQLGPCGGPTAMGQTMAFAQQQIQQIVPRWYIQEVVEFEPCDPMGGQKHDMGTETATFRGKKSKQQRPGWCSVLAPCIEDP